MAERQIIRGDSYHRRRPFFKYTFVDDDGNPLDLTECTVRVTYKPAILAPDADATDATAVIKHHIVINNFGVVTSASGLALSGAATGGVLIHSLTAAESRLIPSGTTYFSDIELTDFNGEVFTWLVEDTLKTKEGVTNRTTD